MPFEPHLLRPDDDDPSDWPSPDLALLAEQLGDDAAALARRYPAKPFSAELVAPARPNRTPWVRRVAAAVLVCAVGGALSYISVLVSDPASSSTHAIVRTAPRVRQRPDSLASVPRALSMPAPMARPQVRAVFFGLKDSVDPLGAFHELSGSEQEAVLDLLEDGRHETAEIAI